MTRFVTLSYVMVGRDDLERLRQRRRELLQRVAQLDDEIEREELQANLADLSPAERRKLWRIISGGAGAAAAVAATIKKHPTMYTAAAIGMVAAALGSLFMGPSPEQEIMEPPRAIGAPTIPPKQPDELDDERAPGEPVDPPSPAVPDLAGVEPAGVSTAPTVTPTPTPDVDSPDESPEPTATETTTPEPTRPPEPTTSPPPSPTPTPTRPGTPTHTPTLPPTPSPSPTPTPTPTPTGTPDDEDYLLCLGLDPIELQVCLDLLDLGGLDLDDLGLVDLVGLSDGGRAGDEPGGG